MKQSICIFWDSIVHWFFDKEWWWANRIKSNLEEQSDFVYVLGIPWDTTQTLLLRLDNECSVREPDKIILSIWINDTIFLRDSGSNLVPIDEFRTNIKKLIDITKSFTDDIVFLTIGNVDEKRVTPMPWEENMEYRNGNIVAYNSALKSILDWSGIRYVDIYWIMEESDLSDWIHPNSLGHFKIYDRILHEII